MLLLNRRVGERIVIGDNIVVTVCEIRANQCRIGIEAPREVTVHREEVSRRIAIETAQAKARQQEPRV